MQKKFLLSLALSSAVLFPASGKAANALHSLCEAPERAVFECQLKAAKLLSLCASPTFPASGSTLQYRFGSAEKIEFRYPEIATNATPHFFYSTTGYSGGGESHIRFANGTHDYILFERTVRVDAKGNKPPRFSSGVIARKAGTLLSIRTCLKGGLQVNIDEYLPKEEFEYIDNLP
jgi:hypothetical protein